MKIESHIQSLLFRYDCVIIPGFGGFVINPKETRISTGNDQFNPPAREITFNQNLTRNDGLLCDAIAAVEQVTYEKAVQQVEAYNRENLKKLSEGLEVELEGVGTFNRDAAGILQFEPNIEANFLRSSFGLSSFRSPAIKRDTVEKVIEKKILKALPKETPIAIPAVANKGGSIIKYWPAAAVFLLLIVASSVLMKSDVLNNISINYSEINPFESNTESVFNSRSNNSTSEEVSAELDEIELWLERLPKESVAPVHKVKTPSVRKRFHIIGGCFEFKANANKLTHRLKKRGFEATLVGKNRRGLHRVAFGSYETRAEAKEALKYVKSTQMKSAWLFVSKK